MHQMGYIGGRTGDCAEIGAIRPPSEQVAQSVLAGEVANPLVGVARLLVEVLGRWTSDAEPAGTDESRLPHERQLGERDQVAVTPLARHPVVEGAPAPLHPG